MASPATRRQTVTIAKVCFPRFCPFAVAESFTERAMNSGEPRAPRITDPLKPPIWVPARRSSSTLEPEVSRP
jgi:hypothetical protein